MALYIHSAHAISPQKNATAAGLEPLMNGQSHPAVDLNYSEYISPAMVRRMSRIIKMGVASGIEALKAAGIEKPDAILSATGFGCFEDSVKFLEQLIHNHESILSPTPFIQSTHNTVGAQIALLTGCNGYNNTHVHGGLSFENCLTDALMHALENPEALILLGAAEELTPAYIALRQKECERTGQSLPMNLGEGAAFFVAGGIPKDSLACVKGVTTFLNPDPLVLQNGLSRLLAQKGVPPESIALVLNGDPYAKEHSSTLNSLLPHARNLPYKNYCGEYYTSSAFACWLGIHFLGELPPGSHVLIANRFQHQYSYLLLSHA